MGLSISTWTWGVRNWTANLLLTWYTLRFIRPSTLISNRMTSFLFLWQLLYPASQHMNSLYCCQSFTCFSVSVSLMHLVAIQTSWQLHLLDEAAKWSEQEVISQSDAEACLFGADLSVAFISDSLNLNLFPPHVSGVEAGGARGGGEVRWMPTDFFLLETSLSACSSPCTLTLLEPAGQGAVTPWFKKKKKDREKEERKNRVGCAAPTSDHGPVSGVRSSTTQAEPGSCALPFTSARQLLKNNIEAFIRLRPRLWRAFVCTVWPTLETPNTRFAFTPDIQQENKWCI